MAPLLEEDVFVGLQRTADWLLQGIEQLLKTQGLSQAQYNVLRILRGAGPRGLSCREIGERMITRDPDMTRLLDRMEERGLVARERQQIDRRVVTTRVTPAGLKLLKSLDHPVREYHRRRFRHIAGARLKTLAVLLEEARKREPG
ncbi:MAG TPA: MarR family transcriptional regulator [Candidatus Acidoferrales bacterium]|nr:MarR family transcriptional regulator [Candidatus Acidoferrales bacterium]